MQAFGLADLGQGYPELGYINLEELTAAGVELDFYWKPKTLAEIRGKQAPEPGPSDQEASYQAGVQSFEAGVSAYKAGEPRQVPGEHSNKSQEWLNGWDAGERITEDEQGDDTGPNAQAIPSAMSEPAPAESTESALRDTDIAFLQSVIDGTLDDILSPELADQIEAAYTLYPGDPELEALFNKAVDAYTQAMLSATATL